MSGPDAGFQRLQAMVFDSDHAVAWVHAAADQEG
jgi:hypothetical protein